MTEVQRYNGELVYVETGEVVPESLDDLAQAANEQHRLANDHAAKAIEHAFRCGEYLTKAKANVKHGEWLPWLEQNFEGTARTATNYMLIFRRQDEIQNRKHVSDLGVRGALEHLREIDEARRPPEMELVTPDPESPDMPEPERQAVSLLAEMPAEEINEALTQYTKKKNKERQKEERRAQRAAERAEAAEKMESIKLDDRVQVVHADFRDALGDLPEGTVDLVLTDPPYPAEYLPLYSELGYMASQCLKDGGVLAAMVGQSYLPDIISRLSEHLTYHWTIGYITPGGQSVQLWQRKVNTFWKPVLIFTKGDYIGDWFGDVAKSDVNDNDKRFHHWGQSESGTSNLMDRLCKPGDMVVDPFVGGGTTAVVAALTGRRFLGCDLDKAAIETTTYRLKEVARVSA